MFPKNITVKVSEKGRTSEVLQNRSFNIEGKEAHIIEAQDNATYELIDNATGLGPQNIMAKRVGDDLWIAFEGEEIDEPGLIIKDFYLNSDEPNILIGLAEDGAYHPYIPESAVEHEAVHLLADQIAAGQTLGTDNVLAAAILPWGRGCSWCTGCGRYSWIGYHCWGWL